MTPIFQLFGLQMVLLIDYRAQLLMCSSQAQSQQGRRPSQPLLPPAVRLSAECRQLPATPSSHGRAPRCRSSAQQGCSETIFPRMRARHASPVTLLFLSIFSHQHVNCACKDSTCPKWYFGLFHLCPRATSFLNVDYSPPKGSLTFALKCEEVLIRDAGRIISSLPGAKEAFAARFQLCFRDPLPQNTPP